MKDEKRIYVWDIFVRIFHWVLVSCIFLNYFITEEGEKPHEIIGYVAAAFVVLRFFWGFFGSYYARFSTWLAGPGTVYRYLRYFKTRRIYMSHNPIAGWMMIFLMTCVIGLGITGFMMGTDRFFGEEWVENLHNIIANVMMAGVAIHVIGALYESYHERQNLVASMVYGFKKDLSK